VLANDTDVDHYDNTSNFILTNVTIVDADGNTLTDQGSVSIVNNKLVFVPGDDFDSLAVGVNATVRVNYVMSDTSGETSTSTATITITGSNDIGIVGKYINGQALVFSPARRIDICDRSVIGAGHSKCYRGVGTCI
jgi:hypothetical protein